MSVAAPEYRNYLGVGISTALGEFVRSARAVRLVHRCRPVRSRRTTAGGVVRGVATAAGLIVGVCVWRVLTRQDVLWSPAVPPHADNARLVRSP
jgi:hypothetical protein